MRRRSSVALLPVLSRAPSPWDSEAVPTPTPRKARCRRGDAGVACVPSALGGLDLHAGVRVAAGHRDRLERLCRYALRPPLADGRLHRTASGDVAVQLRTPWGDRTTHVAFPPTAFLARLAVLIPRPRVNLLLYHGVLAPRASFRVEIVPHAPASARRREARRVAVARLGVRSNSGLALGGPKDGRSRSRCTEAHPDCNSRRWCQCGNGPYSCTTGSRNFGSFTTVRYPQDSKTGRKSCPSFVSKRSSL